MSYLIEKENGPYLSALTDKVNVSLNILGVIPPLKFLKFARFVNVISKVPKLISASANSLTPLRLGSTGRTVAKILVERMAMSNILKNPGLGHVIMEGIKDSRWLGWRKLQYIVRTADGKNAIIHFVGKFENGVLKYVDDFKFK